MRRSSLRDDVRRVLRAGTALSAVLAVVTTRRWWRLRRVHPELREASLGIALPFTAWTVPLLREVLRSPTPVLGGVDHRETLAPPTPDGHRAGLHVYEPHDRDAALRGACVLWLHGGGFVTGSAARDHLTCSEVARDLGVVVVSVDYRLAPAHRHPAALDDASSAVRWLAAGGMPGVDPSRVVVAGASAGGGLAAALVHRLHDEGGPLHPAAQVLVYPMLDDRTLPGAGTDDPRLVWTARSNRHGWRSLLGVEPGTDRVPEDAVPARRGDLTGLPPTWIGVGDADLFLHECVRHAERLVRAGVGTELLVVHGMVHGADASALDTTTPTREFRGAVRAAIRSGLATPGP